MNKWFKPLVILALIIVLALLPLLFHSPYLLHVFILTFIYTVAAVSLRTITISGQFSIAHAAFMGIGAYAAGMTGHYLDWSPWITIPLGAFAAGIVGAICPQACFFAVEHDLEAVAGTAQYIADQELAPALLACRE